MDVLSRLLLVELYENLIIQYGKYGSIPVTPPSGVFLWSVWGEIVAPHDDELLRPMPMKELLRWELSWIWVIEAILMFNKLEKKTANRQQQQKLFSLNLSLKQQKEANRKLCSITNTEDRSALSDFYFSNSPSIHSTYEGKYISTT